MIKKIAFFSVLPSLMLAFAVPCHATGDVVLHSKYGDIASKLEGRWSPDCDNLEGIKIDGHLKAKITVNSNQIVINSFLKEGDKKDGLVGVYLESPLDLGRGGMNLDWDHFSRDHRIAAIKIENESDVIFNWNGFYVGKAKKYQWVSEPDFYGDSGKINFHRCDN
ncbi:hypothetical protein EVC45_17830 [Paraburkholderia sp. UYCP14C]|uniref:hypothetical protein n=1 Tax=Paraburkholderia sp. UYCP14C TaxID=2511130 RepID=UPI00101FC40D|nr:hypothetical protein [Paraburkholderia sp. UYCP14C]RZF28431.1 hypothetical protein EVC45_17830 [Paraburkholderia sp. UYCP14C]